ncbi:hypothetical protein ACFLT4_07565 [Chloroflexota bacterium]
MTEPILEAKADAEPGLRDMVFKGTFEEVTEFFHKNTWTDGLPIVPPTMEKVEEFLNFTDRSPDEVLGVLPPSMAEATVWTVAVNGVMAGCRPEYMPILIAIVEVMADPQYGLKHGGSTPGWEAMILLNGPIRNQLGFNDKVAVQRPGTQANTSIGRFYRLFIRNVPRFLPGITDMATFGHMFRAVVPENEEACAEIGWKPLHVLRGFKPDDNVVTITSIRAVSDPFRTGGEKAERHLDYIVDWVKRMIEPYQSTLGYIETNVLFMSPINASILAKGGYSKEDVNGYIMEHAVVSAAYYDWSITIGGAQPPGTTACKLVEKGVLPREWGKSADPDRLVPLLLPDSQWLIVVTGDPTRTRSCVYRQNFNQGYATSKKIKLPANWDKLMKGLKN